MRYSKFFGAVAVVVFASLVLVQSSDAQRRGFMRMGGGAEVTEISLLQMEEVIKHLQADFGLKDETVEKLSDLAEDTQEEIRAESLDMREEMQDAAGDREAIQELMGEFRKTVEKINVAAWKEAKGMLDEKQLKRISQLKIQRMGAAALRNKKIQEELGFSEEQTEKVKKAQEKFAEEQQEMMAEFRENLRGGDREEMREKVAEFREQQTEMREEMQKKVVGVLSDKQKKKFEEMKGEKFEFPERQGRRGRGR